MVFDRTLYFIGNQGQKQAIIVLIKTHHIEIPHAKCRRVETLTTKDKVQQWLQAELHSPGNFDGRDARKLMQEEISEGILLMNQAAQAQGVSLKKKQFKAKVIVH